jgi:acetyl-CoA acetyltransferase
LTSRTSDGPTANGLGRLAAFGIMAALWERERSGLGQVIDAAIVDGVASMMTMFAGLLSSGRLSLDKHNNPLGGAAPFYRCYACADGAEMLATKYDLSKDELDQFAFESHRKAIAATQAGEFAEQIVPIATSGSEPNGHRVDEGIRFDASLEGIRSVNLLTLSESAESAPLKPDQRRHRASDRSGRIEQPCAPIAVSTSLRHTIP